MVLHKSQKRKRNADRIKTILLLNKGFTQKEVSEILLLDENTVGKYKNSYLNRKDETSWFQDNYTTFVGKLSYTALSHVLTYCDNFKVVNKAEINNFIKATFGVKYKPTGLQKLLNRIGISFKQLHRLPGKVDIIPFEL